ARTRRMSASRSRTWSTPRTPTPSSSGDRSASSSSTSSTSRPSRWSRAAVIVAGAGMAGLCAAARARELGAAPVVLEKGNRAGGSMLLSSGFAWRYRTFEVFRAQCPGGDPALQRLVLERFDDAADWLERLGAPVVSRETG